MRERDDQMILGHSDSCEKYEAGKSDRELLCGVPSEKSLRKSNL